MLGSLAARQGNRGRSLENLMEQVFESAAHRGEPLKIFHQVNEWVPLKNGKTFPRKGAPIDFVGAYKGIPVAIEAKEVATGQFFSLHPTRLPEKEVRALEEFERAGGKAFLVIAFWQYSSIAFIPFAVLKAALKAYREKTGPASLSVKNLGPYVLNVGDLLFDLPLDLLISGAFQEGNQGQNQEITCV